MPLLNPVLVLKDEEWIRGRLESALIILPPNSNADDLEGRKCCLGIAARNFGVSDDRLSAHGLPHSVPSDLRDDVANIDASAKDDEEVDRVQDYVAAFSKRLGLTPHLETVKLECAIAEINDNSNLTDEARVEQLKPLFRQAGFTDVVFEPSVSMTCRPAR